MSVSEDLQQLSMIEWLPHLLAGGDTSHVHTQVDSVVPNKLQALPNGGPEFHMVAANTFRTILEENLVPPSTFTQTFLPSIVASIECLDPCTSEAWLNTLLDVIDLLPPDVLKTDVLPIAVSRGQLSQSPQCRVSSCKLLGRIATKFDSSQLRKEVVPLVHSLCQDVCGEVRASMCYQLPQIAQGLCTDAVKPDLLPLFVDLAMDEEPAVRLAAVHTISCVVTVLPTDVLKHTIAPLIMKLCDRALLAEDRVLCAITEKYGQLCNGLKGALSENDKVWFLQFFKKLARLGVTKAPVAVNDIKSVSDYVHEREHFDILLQCREQTAANFPSVVRFCGPALFEEILYSTYAALVCDQSSNVRRCIAGGIHEILQELGSKCHLVQSELILLLTDDSRDVLQAVVPHLHFTLQHLTKNSLISPAVADSVAHDLIRAILKCELVLSLSTDWRLHSIMLGQLEHTPGAFPSDLIFSNVCGVLFHRIQDSRALPCRLAAAHALLVLLRHTSKVEHRNEIRNRIFTELCIHHSCHVRLLFVKMCGMAMDIFSSLYIKEHFFLRLLSLAGDLVPNVRLVLCDLLPRLKSLLKMPQDSNLMSALQDAIERLQTSNRPDRDVSFKLQSACLAMDRISCDTVEEIINVEDLSRYQEEQEIESKSSVSEPKRLITVNMKTLGEGKRATLVSLRSPDVSRPDYRQSSGCNIAVSSYGVCGGYPSVESKITASITSTTCDASHSFNSLTSTPKDTSTSSNSAYPVLREEEFYIDAGVPLPEKLTDMQLSSTAAFSSSDPARSKIPNLRELLFQNSTLLAQVSNRESLCQRDTSMKSAHPKTVLSNSSPGSGANKRFSRIFSENTSASGSKHISVINKPSAPAGTRRDFLGSKQTQEKSSHEEDQLIRYKDNDQYNPKALPSSPLRLNATRKESKAGDSMRRGFIYSPNQGIDHVQEDKNSDRDRHFVSVARQRSLDRPKSPPVNSINSLEEISNLQSGAPKIRNGFRSKSSIEFSPNPVNCPTRIYNAVSKVSVPKMSSDSLYTPSVSLEHSGSHDRGKEDLKFLGASSTKRYSMRHGQVQSSEKRVSLSSIGVNSVRRTYNPVSRPQSCLILSQNDRGSSVNARSLSQESLGLEHGKAGMRAMGRISQGFGMSRIPRGGPGAGGSGSGTRAGSSCHSSPGNSRCVSPSNGPGLVSRTAPCSPGGSRATSPSRSEPRVSLASIKLHEPSKLPIRKYNHHV